MNLSKRLMTVVDLVREGNAVCDVGCDHAYTSIELVRTKAPCAVASDVRSGPLDTAREHVAEAGLADRIRTVLADGVPKDICALLPEGVPASLIITGMGGMLTIRILTEAGELLHRFDEIILSPQSDIYAVRLFLVENGYSFADEAEVLEDGKFYTIMKLRPRRNFSEPGKESILSDETELGKESILSDETESGKEPILSDMMEPGNAGANMSKAQLLYGPCLLAAKDETLYMYLARRRKVLSNIKEKLIDAGRGIDDARLREVEEELETIYEAERYYGEAGCGFSLQPGDGMG